MHIKAHIWDREGLRSAHLELPLGTIGVTIVDRVEDHDVEVTYDDEMPSVELSLDGVTVKDFDSLAVDGPRVKAR